MLASFLISNVFSSQHSHSLLTVLHLNPVQPPLPLHDDVRLPFMNINFSIFGYVSAPLFGSQNIFANSELTLSTAAFCKSLSVTAINGVASHEQRWRRMFDWLTLTEVHLTEVDFNLNQVKS